MNHILGYLAFKAFLKLTIYWITLNINSFFLIKNKATTTNRTDKREATGRRAHIRSKSFM